MKKRLAIAGAIVALVVLGLGAYAARLAARLDTPEAKAWILDQARQALGVEVQAKELHASLFRGLELRGVRVANPPGFSGPLLTADAFALKYELWPLLIGRLHVDELSLDKPVVQLAMDGRGTFNYERLGPRPEAGARASGKPSGSGGGAGSGTGGSGVPAGLPIELALSHLALRDARISLVDARKAAMLKVEGAELSSGFKLAGSALDGSGRARIASLGLADALFVRGLEAPIEARKRGLRLGPIRGRLAEGRAEGDLRVDLGEAFRYSLSLKVEGAKVEALLKEAGARPTLAGSLAAEGSFEGTGGVPTLTGKGWARVDDCRTNQSPLLLTLAALLQIRELANPDLDECRAEFTLGGGRARTPVLSLKGREVRLTGSGVTTLADGALDYDMTLALSRRLLAGIPAKEIRAAFDEEREDGFGLLSFRVTGTTAAPKTDVAARIAKSGALAVVKGKLGKLFGRDK
jgi:hypothetical protein